MLEVTDDNFNEEVLNSTIPTLIDFWAPWCGPCHVVSPVLEELEGEYASKIKFLKMNVDDSPRVPSRYGIRAIPTLIIFKNGEILKQMVGIQSKSDLKGVLDNIPG